MPDRVFTIVVKKTIGGTGSRGEHSNVYHVLGTDATTDAELTLKAKALGIAEARQAGKIVTFTRAMVGTYAKDGVLPDDEGSMPVSLAFKGTKDLVSGAYSESGVPQLFPVGKVPPPEACLAVVFTAGRSRSAPHTYRYSIADDQYANDGTGLQLEQVVMDNVSSVWRTLLEQQGDTLKLCKPAKTATGLPAKLVTEINCVGIQMRQLDARRGKQKIDLKLDTDSPGDAEDLIGTAVEALNTINTRRYTPEGATFVDSPRLAAALSSLLGVATLVKAARDAHDYGDIMIGQ